MEIETKCRHCGQAIRISMDSGMKFSISEKRADPLVFMPDVNWDTFAERTIIDSY